MNQKRSIIVLVLALGLLLTVPMAQANPLAITTSTNAVDMVNALLWPGITAVSGSQSYVGASAASGFFSGGSGILGFDTGIVLTTGNATLLPGPNTKSSSPHDLWVDNGAAGYAPLQAINGGIPTINASVLSFSFVPPAAGVVSFRFIFGSEEYKENVFTYYNDAFACYLNGTNIALVPWPDGTSQPMTIDTVNHIYNPYNAYTDNPMPSPPLNTRLDGLAGNSTPLYATGPVNAGQTNTIVVAIADSADGYGDSAVFLQMGSFQPVPLPATLLLLGSGLLALGGFSRKFRRG
jgi:hypothetical protein